MRELAAMYAISKSQVHRVDRRSRTQARRSSRVHDRHGSPLQLDRRRHADPDARPRGCRQVKELSVVVQRPAAGASPRPSRGRGLRRRSGQPQRYGPLPRLRRSRAFAESIDASSLTVAIAESPSSSHPYSEQPNRSRPSMETASKTPRPRGTRDRAGSRTGGSYETIGVEGATCSTRSRRFQSSITLCSICGTALSVMQPTTRAAAPAHRPPGHELVAADDSPEHERCSDAGALVDVELGQDAQGHRPPGVEARERSLDARTDAQRHLRDDLLPDGERQPDLVLVRERRVVARSFMAIHMLGEKTTEVCAIVSFVLNPSLISVCTGDTVVARSPAFAAMANVPRDSA